LKKALQYSNSKKVLFTKQYKMAKEKERRTARILYVEQGKSGKEIAELLSITEKTVSDWVNKFGWKKARTAAVSSKENRIDNLMLIVDQLAADRLELSAKLKQAQDEEAIKTLRSQIADTDSAISKWAKQIESVNKEGSITLGTYLSVMKSIFTAMQRYSPELYFKTIDFQDQHINEQSSILD
jgi:predicted transcriptional regulator